MLKLSMLFSISESDDKIVRLSHLEGALALLRDTEQHLRAVMDLITASATGSQVKAVLTMIQRFQQISRSRLLSMMAHQISSRELTDVIETLSHSRAITITAVGADIIYRATSPGKESP